MSKLYTSLAQVYHEIYQSLFDYDEEFVFYDKHFKANQIKSILEIGCGTGNLAKRIIASKYDYLGLDLFQEMLDIAKQNEPKAALFQADIRDFSLEQKFDCAIITGRSISYLIDNQGVADAFKCINDVLNKNGILMFDAIDASQLFVNFVADKEEIIYAKFGRNHYKRISKIKKNLQTGWTWDWRSDYFKENNEGEFDKIGEDFSTLRAFLKEEINLFLNLTGFKLLETLPKKSYTWNDNFFIAKKIN